MDPLPARLDRFVRWFFSSSPSEDFECGGGKAPAAVELPLSVERQSKKSSSATVAVEVCR